MSQESVKLTVTRADNQIAAYLNGSRVYFKSTDNDPYLNDVTDLTDKLNPNLNTLLIVGVNWGGPYNFTGNLNAYGTITNWSASKNTSPNGIVWSQSFNIAAMPDPGLVVNSVELIQAPGKTWFISGSIQIKNNSSETLSQYAVVSVDFYLSNTDQNKDNLIPIGDTGLIFQQAFLPGEKIPFFMPDRSAPNRLANISRFWSSKTVPPGEYYVYANLRQDNGNTNAGAFTKMPCVKVRG